MPYIIASDFERLIQSEQLSELTNDNTVLLGQKISWAEAQVKSYLKQRYDLTKEFRPLRIWNPLVEYLAGERVYLSASAFSEDVDYLTNDLVDVDGIIYLFNDDIPAGVFDADNCTLIGEAGTIFYGKLPAPEFSSITIYEKDGQVFYEDKVYPALHGSDIVTQQQMLNAQRIENVVKDNPLPGTTAGQSMWGDGEEYFIEAGTLPTDTDYWVDGDNRDQVIMEAVISFVIYGLCSRIAPNNVPTVHKDNYTHAMATIKDIALGNIGTELPLLQPVRNTPISYGGEVKQINSW